MIWLAVIGAILLVVVLIWEFWVCEGAHLGRRFVVSLYNLAATRYDRIKRFDPDWERAFLGEPLANALGGLEGARLLDVGAGTGRIARALGPLPFFRGVVIGIEPARRMLELARQRVPGRRALWVRGWAVPLPFPAETFDLVASLEMLEFTPHPQAALREMVRVLVPGGWLLVTNRIGRQARWIFGRTYRRGDIAGVLERLGLEEVQARFWQVDYDLVWGRKRPRG
jgi:ubiquinone/menaquinone biosynthesis C-methylase UbiE